MNKGSSILITLFPVPCSAMAFAAFAIMGVEPIEKYDEMVAGIKERGMEKILAMKQASYDRYLAKLNK